MKRIGERIKKKREQYHLQLNELAEKIGISPSALSQIEKAKSYPSVITLKTIAEKLHTTVGELIGENEQLTNHPVVHQSEMKLIDQNKSGTLFYLLSHHDAQKQMDAYLIRFSKASAIDGFFTHAIGQIFSYVLSGEVRFDLDGKSYVLKPGDNIYFNCRSQFNAVNYCDGISEIIWVQSPPHFLNY